MVPSQWEFFNCDILFVVVWNPWAEKAKAMTDFGDEEYKQMLCVEAGYVTKPVTIGSNMKVEFGQALSIMTF